MIETKELPVNVVRLLADKTEIENAMRRYTVALGCTKEFAYEKVIDEVSEHLPIEKRPWKPYKNYLSYVASQKKK